MAENEKLIQTVYAYPVLNVSLHDYRRSERRVNAWREVAASVGLSVVQCKLKREEGGRRLHYWPHRESLSFLDAHIRKRKRPSDAAALEDAEDADGSAHDSLEESLDESSGGDSKSSLEHKAKSAAKHQLRAATAAPLNPLSPLPLSIVTQLAPVKPLQHMRPLALAVSALPPGLKVASASSPASAPALLTPSASPSELSGQTPEKEPLKSCEKAERAFDEDELFLLSYVPALKRLTPQKRAAAKMQIQQIMFDAEFKDQ